MSATVGKQASRMIAEPSNRGGGETMKIATNVRPFLLCVAVFASLGSLPASAQPSQQGQAMRAEPTLEAVIVESHEALRKILNGDPSGYAALFADRDDITLGNPFGPF